MVYARRHALPDYVRVNKAGAISVLSFIRYLELPDDVIFKIEVGEDKTLVLTPTNLLEISDNF